MCACCLANFLLHEPYQACEGPAYQAWRHTHMLERRAKQALQSALPSGFWGMPPPAPPRTGELEPWQLMQTPQPQSGDAPPPAGDLEPWQILQRPQRQQPESVWTAHGYSAGPPPPPPQGPLAKPWGPPPPHAGSMPCGLASSASLGPAAAAPLAAAAPATALSRNEAMVLLTTIAQRLDELKAKVSYIAGQVQVLMDQSCQAV